MCYQETGIDVEFEFEATKQNRRFLNDLPPHIGEPVDVMHATIMYPDELASAGLAAHERAKLLDVRKEVSEALAELGLTGQTLGVEPDKLWPKKKWMTMQIDEESAQVCNQARKTTSEVIADILGIQLPTYSPSGYHISVARRYGGGRRPVEYRRRFPSEVSIANVSVKDNVVTLQTGGQPRNAAGSFYRPPLVRAS